MDATPVRFNRPRFKLLYFPDDVMIYILDFLDSSALASMALGNRYLQTLVTPTLYRNIIIPGGGGELTQLQRQRSTIRLLRTLSKRPSLTVLLRHLENAPPIILHPRLESTESIPASWSLSGLLIDVMTSCVNLQSLTVAGTVSSHLMIDGNKWSKFLLSPSIKLKSLKIFVSVEDGRTWSMWNRLVAQILDVQLSLEHLDYSFDNKNPAFSEERVEKWAPKLRVLGGNNVGGFRALVSNKRPIETVVVRSASVADIRRSFGAQLKKTDTIKELVYQGPEVDCINFEDLFETVPSLRIFRGETSLSVVDSLENLFWQDLPQAFALTPHLTEFHLRHRARLPEGGLSAIQPEFSHLYLPPSNEEWPRRQAALLERYSAIWPQLRVFTFPDGRQWRWMEDGWVFCDKFKVNAVG